MPEQKNKNIIPSAGGFVQGISDWVKLVVRLMGDRRVSFWLKLLPGVALTYLLAPDLLPLNPVDDALVVWLGFYLFTELCPPEIVDEHRKKIQGMIDGKFKQGPKNKPAPEEIIDGEFRPAEDEPPQERKP
ncbi:MAG TPA: hypothetical protein VIO61_03750 [Anaerolineaceae bacterium]